MKHLNPFFEGKGRIKIDNNMATVGDTNLPQFWTTSKDYLRTSDGEDQTIGIDMKSFIMEPGNSYSYLTDIDDHIDPKDLDKFLKPLKNLKSFENFNPYDDEPLTRTEMNFGKQTRLEKQFSEIMVRNLIEDETGYWSTLNAMKIEIIEILGDKSHEIVKELKHRVVEGEDADKVFLSICERIEKTPELNRLIKKIQEFNYH